MVLDVRLGLLQGFELRNGTPLELPIPAQRLVALLALQGSPVRRGYVAGALWPDLPEDRAAANLRTAVWRVRGRGPAVVVSLQGNLALHPGVVVDLHRSLASARSVEALGTDQEVSALVDQYEAELLPDWYEDWLLVWRERWQHTRVAALEALSERLRLESRLSLSIQAAAAAVRAEPLRESARRVLIAAYLGEGNPGQAHVELARFERVLDAELGIAPSAFLVEMVRGTPIPQ